MKCQSGRCRLAIASSDTDYFAVAFVPPCQFNLADDGDPLLPDNFHQVIFLRDTRALDNFICTKDKLFIMATFFEGYACCLQLVTIIFFQRTSIGKEYIISLLLCKQCSTDAAFATAQYDHTFAHNTSSRVRKVGSSQALVSN